MKRLLVTAVIAVAIGLGAWALLNRPSVPESGLHYAVPQTESTNTSPTELAAAPKAGTNSGSMQASPSSVSDATEQESNRASGPSNDAPTPLPGTVSMSRQDARTRIEATLRAHPQDYSLRMQAAEFYMNSGLAAEAIPHLQAATRLSARVFTWIALGDAATLAGRFGLAQQAYDRADVISPHNSLTMRGRAQLLIAQHKIPEAQQVLESGLKRYPGNMNLGIALGNLYLLQNKPRKVIALLEPIAREEFEIPEVHEMLGEAYARDIHFDSAIREMREAVKRNPDFADAWGHLGQYLVNIAHYEEARQPLERAIALNPMESYFYWTLGDSYLLDNPAPARFEKALQLYRQSLNLNPNNTKALYSYAMALTRRGRPDDLQVAVGLFTRLLKLIPSDMNAEYKLFETYSRLGRPREANLHRSRFESLFAKGRDQTRQRYQMLSFKDTAQVHVKLGKTAIASGDFPLAVREFQLALERDPAQAEARRGLSDAQKRLQSGGSAPMGN